MQSSEPLPLRDRWLAAATAWCTATGRTLGALSSKVANDGNAFDRPNPTVETLAKFARFLIDPANWPEGAVAQEAVSLAHVTGVSLPSTALPEAGATPAEGAASAGKSGEMSGDGRAAA